MTRSSSQRSRARILFLLTLAALMGGCGSTSSLGGTGATGTLVVRELGARGGDISLAGSVGYAEVSSPRGAVFDEPVEHGRLVRTVPTGRYTLIYSLRPCRGDCSRPGRPSLRCTSPFEVNLGVSTLARVLITPGEACVVRVLQISS